MSTFAFSSKDLFRCPPRHTPRLGNFSRPSRRSSDMPAPLKRDGTGRNL